MLYVRDKLVRKSFIDGTVEISLSGQLNRANNFTDLFNNKKGVDLMVFPLKIKEDSHPFIFHSRHSPTVKEISIENSEIMIVIPIKINPCDSSIIRVFPERRQQSRLFVKKKQTFSWTIMPPAAAMTSGAH